MRRVAVVLALLASAALADGTGLAARAELPVQELMEGERATAVIRLRNEAGARVVLLSIEAEDAVESLLLRPSQPLDTRCVEENAAEGTLLVHRSAYATRELNAPPSLLRVVELAPGEEATHEVVFKAPAGHVYAVHFRVTYVSLERAVADGRVFVPLQHGEKLDPTPYRTAKSTEAVKKSALLRVEGLGDAEVARTALAVEVKPRGFSFAAAAKEAGVVPDAATWFETGGLWAIAANGKTYLVAEGEKSELVGNCVPFLSDVALRDRKTVPLTAPEEDVLATWLRGEGIEVETARDGSTVFRVPAQRVLEILRKADELGFTVTAGGWKRRE